MATVLRSATSITLDVEGLRLVLASTVGGELYAIEVPDDGSEVRLRRRRMKRGPPLRGRGRWDRP